MALLRFFICYSLIVYLNKSDEMSAGQFPLRSLFLIMFGADSSPETVGLIRQTSAFSCWKLLQVIYDN